MAAKPAAKKVLIKGVLIGVLSGARDRLGILVVLRDCEDQGSQHA
jgi:hypothetical protein